MSTTSKRQYFGTDGIRGTANIHPMTAELALKVGMAAGHYFKRGSHRHRVVIGKDTRRSCYMFEQALTAGFAAVGMDVITFGPTPTPAVAMLTRSMRADLGVMLSASHNPHHDNGIKLFGPDGYKLNDDIEHTIESLINDPAADMLVPAEEVGKVTKMEDTRGRYMEFVKRSLPRGSNLDGLKIVIDCAHGAAYKVAPTVLWELGADVVPIGVAPNGFNINDGCGSTAPQAMAEAVRQTGADIGIALDGDADRVIICDENGDIVDGDQLMAIIANAWHQQGMLKSGAVVATVMSNLGLERHLNSLGLQLERTPVGDRYVVERMRAMGANLGGEQSGHIVLGDVGTTGDGLVAGLQVLMALKETGKPMSELGRQFETVPQTLTNVRYQRGSKPLESADVQQVIQNQEKRLGNDGRIVIRPSGTEPVIRVMVEHGDSALVTDIASTIANAVEKAAATG